MKKMSIVLLSLLLLLALPVCGEIVTAMQEIAKPESMAAAKDRLYISEKEAIYIYSMKDFRLVKKIGKQGEGPGEFKISPFGSPLIIYPFGDQIAVNSYNKLSYFSKDGEFIKERKIRPFWMYQPLGDRFLALGYAAGKNQQQVMAVILCDKDLKIVKILNVSDINMGFRGKYEFPFSAIGFQAYKERAYAAVGNDFTIDVFDKKGDKLYQIKKKHEPLPLTREYETKTVDSFKKNPNYMQFWPFIRSRLKYKSHFPAIQDLYVKNDRIYVITYKRKGEKTECVILDLQGNERKRVFIAYPVFYGLDFKLPFAFHDHNVYRLIDNEEKEVWELHKQKLE